MNLFNFVLDTPEMRDYNWPTLIEEVVMKTVFVNPDMFKEIMEKIGAEQTGSDVGRTHGKFQYTRHYGTRWVGSSSYLVQDGAQSWLYSVAAYLYEAYK